MPIRHCNNYECPEYFIKNILGSDECGFGAFNTSTTENDSCMHRLEDTYYQGDEEGDKNKPRCPPIRGCGGCGNLGEMFEG